MFNFVCAALVFCGAVAVASYTPQWTGLLSGNALSDGIVNRVVGTAAAAAVSYAMYGTDAL